MVPDYHHVAVATGGRQVHIAGQVAWDEHGTLVAPGDLTGQVAQVYRNVAKSLAAAGATFADVVRVTWYAAGWRREMYDAFRAGVEQAREELGITTTRHPRR
ncbi:RidA family protein [Amycolatopsis sp. NPDC051061]|uniref:RidA family protein n=1 Tax=Amycolatopsis sp. NPDC051061 TaxID=3155042 RepID=UPI00341BDD24